VDQIAAHQTHDQLPVFHQSIKPPTDFIPDVPRTWGSNFHSDIGDDDKEEE
jgi:hypothetical protein